VSKVDICNGTEDDAPCNGYGAVPPPSKIKAEANEQSSSWSDEQYFQLSFGVQNPTAVDERGFVEEDTGEPSEDQHNRKCDWSRCVVVHLKVLCTLLRDYVHTAFSI